MLELIINFILYFFTFLYLYRKEGGFTINSCCFLYISIVALLGVMIYDSEYYMWGKFNIYVNHTRNQMSIVPLFFLYVGFMIYYSAIKDINSKDIVKIIPVKTWVENTIYYINILLFVITILSYKDAAFNVTDYLDAYNGDVSDIKVGNGLGRLGLWSMIISTGLSTSQVLLPFYLLAKNEKKNYVKSGIFLSLYFFSAFIKGSAIGSRGVLFFAIVNLIFAFIFFRHFLDKRIVRTLTVIFVYVGFLLGSVAILISQDRFGDDFILRICSYFGEPFNNFPLIYWDYPEFLHGNYLLSSMNLVELRYLKVGTFYFKTLPGALYIDFGVIGAILFLMIYALFFKKILGKVSSIITMEKLLIYFYFFLGLEFGVFSFSVYGWSGYVILILNYFLFKIGRAKITTYITRSE